MSGDITDFARVIEATYRIFNIRFTLYGFEMSYWQVFIFTIVASLLVWAIGRLFE
jgi:hypothetical protein